MLLGTFTLILKLLSNEPKLECLRVKNYTIV